MVGFYERSTILSRKKERFTDFNTLNTWLTAQGSSFGRMIPLYSIGSDGNDSNIIGHWGYDSDGKIVPVGVIRFDRITDGGHAIIESVTDGTTAVVKTDPASTLPASGQALAFDLSAGTNLYSGINFSIADTTLTLPDTTGLAAGDVIYAQGRSEFTWGSGSAFDFHPRENCTSFISGSAKGIYVSGSVYPVKPLKANCLGLYRYSGFSGSLDSYTISQVTSSIAFGWHTPNNVFYAVGCALGDAGQIRGTNYTNTSWGNISSWSGINLSISRGFTGMVMGRRVTSAEDQMIIAFGNVESTYSIANVPFARALYTNLLNTAPCFLSAEPTVFKLLRC